MGRFLKIRSVFCISAFVAGMAIVTVLLNFFEPNLEIPQVAAKLRNFAVNSPKFDTVFLGSSRVRRQFSPEVFDRQMGSNGFAVQSINLGIDAMVAPELVKFSDEIMRRKGPIRYWIMDLNTLRRIVPAESDAPRELWWHDWYHTSLVLRDIATNPVPLADTGSGKLSLAVSHTVLMLRHYLRLGEGSELLNSMIIPNTRRYDGDDKNRGFHPETQTLPITLNATFQAELAAMKEGKKIQYTDPVMDVIYREMSARSERENIRLFFVMMPVISLRRPPLPPNDVLARHTLIAFDDPVKYPELYRQEDRYDLQHFNAAGAVVFTQSLARAMAADLKSKHGNN